MHQALQFLSLQLRSVRRIRWGRNTDLYWVPDYAAGKASNTSNSSTISSLSIKVKILELVSDRVLEYKNCFKTYTKFSNLLLLAMLLY